MERHPRISRLLTACALLCALLPLAAQHLTPAATRTSPDDLELTGLTPSPAYLSRAQLLHLHPSKAVIEHDPDFPGLTLHVSGVRLESLAQALSIPASDLLIDALCTDGYHSHYPADYLAQHHPILVLKVEGQDPALWAEQTKHEDPGQYFVAHDHFEPTFHVLSHDDQRQVPINVVRLNISTEDETYTPITPPGPATEQVTQGFTIAKQNCLRCHASGKVGGTKSPFTWSMLATMAKANPEGFARYIHDPRSMHPAATMPANSTYDQPTLQALTAYFAALTPTTQEPR